MDGYGFQEAITVKPDDQLDIPHDELEKECDPLVLTADDPKCPENVTHFSMPSKAYAKQETFDMVAIQFSQEGSIFQKNSPEEAEEQAIRARRYQEQILRDTHEGVEIPEIDVIAIKKNLTKVNLIIYVIIVNLRILNWPTIVLIFK